MITPQFWAGLLTGLLIAPLALLGIAALLSMAYDVSEPTKDEGDEYF